MVQLSLTRSDYQKLLSCYGLPRRAWLEKLFKHLFHFFKTVIKVFKVLATCLKNEAVNQLKANFIYWKATRVSLDHTHYYDN